MATSVANWSDAQLSDTTTATIPQKWATQSGAKVALGLAPSATATVTASETCFMQASRRVEVNAVGIFPSRDTQELPKEKLLEVLGRFPEERRQIRPWML